MCCNEPAEQLSNFSGTQLVLVVVVGGRLQVERQTLMMHVESLAGERIGNERMLCEQRCSVAGPQLVEDRAAHHLWRVIPRVQRERQLLAAIELQAVMRAGVDDLGLHPAA